MESDLVDAVGGGIVVLNWLLTADVEDFDHFISTSTCDASTIWMELHRLDTSVMIVESSDKSLRGNIPQFAGAVLGSRGDESSIRGEHSRVDPVSMGTDGEHESAILELEDLQVLVI